MQQHDHGIKRKKIVIVTQYFPPEIGGAAHRSVGFAEELATLGADVTVIAPFPSYLMHGGRPRFRFRLFERERRENFVVYRTFVAMNNRRSFGKRLVYYLSFTLSAILVLLLRIKEADYIMAISPPIFTGIVGIVAKRLRAAIFVLDVGDLWSEAAVQLQILRKPSSIRRARRFERWVYQNADHINLVTRRTFDRLCDDRSLRARMSLVPNFVDTTFIMKGPPHTNLARHLGLSGKMVFGYTGNIGHAQGIQNIVHAAQLTRQIEDIIYLIIGEGVEQPDVERLIRDHALNNVILHPPVSREEIPAFLSLIDVMIIPLVKAELFKETGPSKLYESMAAEIPVILCVDGEARRIVERSRCGVYVEPGDPVQLAGAVLDFYQHPERIGELGPNGRTMAVEQFAIEKVVGEFWEELAGPMTGVAEQASPAVYGFPQAAGSTRARERYPALRIRRG
ncbi:MAG TPA: glycosyltransferase family 4 protein [Bacteroidota bacterium]